jgi:hypothetical protein
VLRIDGSNRTIQETYTVPGLIPSIFYEPVNENIYVYATSSLWIIGTTSSQTSLSTNSTEFTDIILNNLTGELNIPILLVISKNWLWLVNPILQIMDT